MEVLGFLLGPLVWIMDLLLNMGIAVTGSAGASILLLSLLGSIALNPLQNWANGIESTFLQKHEKVKSELALINPSLKGEQKFLAEERVYEKNRYHPIQQIYISMTVVVALPVLIAAIILFSDNGALQEVSFGFITDLSRPDGLLAGINLMPILLFSVTLTDALIRFRNNRSMLARFLLISIVLFVLVYAMSAALILYWIGNNLVSMAFHHFRKSESGRGEN